MLNLYNANNHQNTDPEIKPETLSELSKTKNGNGAKKPSYEKYVDPSGEFDSRSLKWGMWYVRNKILLYRVFLGGLVFISLILWGYSLWKWGDYLVFGMSTDAKVRADLARFYNYDSLNDRFMANPLQILDVQTFENGVGKSDATAMVLNPNSNFLVRFEYYFDFGGFKTDLQTAVFLPGESRPLSVGGLSDTDLSASPNLVIEKLAWTRIDAHEIPNAEEWEVKHLDFSVSDFSFSHPREENGADAYAIKFKLTNNSSFGYKEASFSVGLYNGSTLVGVLPLTIKNFKSGETREVDLRSFSQNLLVSEVLPYPAIDITDQEIFMAPEK